VAARAADVAPAVSHDRSLGFPSSHAGHPRHARPLLSVLTRMLLCFTLLLAARATVIGSRGQRARIRSRGMRLRAAGVS
jgi:hypothetical protein